jgi:hypothetical protein
LLDSLRFHRLTDAQLNVRNRAFFAALGDEKCERRAAIVVSQLQRMRRSKDDRVNCGRHRTAGSENHPQQSERLLPMMKTSFDAGSTLTATDASEEELFGVSTTTVMVEEEFEEADEFGDDEEEDEEDEEEFEEEEEEFDDDEDFDDEDFDDEDFDDDEDDDDDEEEEEEEDGDY